MPPRPRSRRHFYFPMADTPPLPQRWQKLRTEPHATTRIFDVTRVIYRHPRKDAEQDFVVINAPDWVNVVALTPEHRLVLVRQFRYGTDDFSLEIPGGVIDPGEGPIAAGGGGRRGGTGHAGSAGRPLGRAGPKRTMAGNRGAPRSGGKAPAPV